MTAEQERRQHRIAVPRQLPPAPHTFIGREEQLEILDSSLSRALNPQTSAAPFVLTGPGGAGKTWLALHWAYRNSHHFPDGQLFVDLQGFSSAGQPLTSMATVRGFLDALGVEPAGIPVDPQAQSGLLRSLLHPRRVLILLDNAVDAAQVIPVLPGGSACTVVVTSRNQLPGLVNNYGAQHVDVGMLTDAEARDLLTVRLGAARLESEPEALDALLDRCGGYPLALSIVAGRVQLRSTTSVADLATELAHSSNTLDGFKEDDSVSSLPEVLSWSYSALPAQEAEVFRLLGIAPGPDISVAAATALTGLPAETTRAALRRLTRISLLTQSASGRYGMHDLVRLYARECAGRDQPVPSSDAAIRRVLDFYVRTASSGDRLLDPHATTPPELEASPVVSRPIAFGDQKRAMDWFAAEYPCLQSAQDLADRQDLPETVCLLAWCLAVYRWKRGYLHDNVVACEAGLRAARRLGDVAIRTRAHRNLGAAYARVDRTDAARDQLYQALTLARANHDRAGEARAHRLLALAVESDQPDEALEHATQAFTLYKALGNRLLEADACNAVGQLTARQGRPGEAAVHCHAALDLHRHHNDPDGEAAALEALGFISRQRGDHAQALQHFEGAYRLFHSLGYTYAEAHALEQVAHTCATLGDRGRARNAGEEARHLYEAQGRSDAVKRIDELLDRAAPRHD